MKLVLNHNTQEFDLEMDFKNLSPSECIVLLKRAQYVLKNQQEIIERYLANEAIKNSGQLSIEHNNTNEEV
jgi:hypothetical protein